MVHKPTFMAYELRLLWHTNPNFYAIWPVFIGGGGGLQNIDLRCAPKQSDSYQRSYAHTIGPSSITQLIPQEFPGAIVAKIIIILT